MEDIVVTVWLSQHKLDAPGVFVLPTVQIAQMAFIQIYAQEILFLRQPDTSFSWLRHQSVREPGVTAWPQDISALRLLSSSSETEVVHNKKEVMWWLLRVYLSEIGKKYRNYNEIQQYTFLSRSVREEINLTQWIQVIRPVDKRQGGIKWVVFLLHLALNAHFDFS